MWVKAALRIVAGLAIIIVAFAIYDVATYDRSAWRRDYEHLKREMAQRYANLDWMVSHRRMNLRALDAETTSAIDGAVSHVQAFLALRDFIRAFRDPHLRLVWRNGPQIGEWKLRDRQLIGSCEDARYGKKPPGYLFDRFATWTHVRGGNFETGIAGRTLGVLRISTFDDKSYIEACRAAFRGGLGMDELRTAVRAELRRQLIAAIDELKARGATTLLVDITGNGGGTEWVNEVVTLFTDREMTRSPARLAVPGCDRSGIWRGEPVCPVLAPQGEPARLTGTGQWTGPLFILVDRNTASASEDFVAWLQQNGIAKVAGERTLGAGCGYVDGGGHIQLGAIPFDVMAPNCARYLNDGTNEIEGIRPDLPTLAVQSLAR